MLEKLMLWSFSSNINHEEINTDAKNISICRIEHFDNLNELENFCSSSDPDIKGAII